MYFHGCFLVVLALFIPLQCMFFCVMTVCLQCFCKPTNYTLLKRRLLSQVCTNEIMHSVCGHCTPLCFPCKVTVSAATKMLSSLFQINKIKRSWKYLWLNECFSLQSEWYQSKLIKNTGHIFMFPENKWIKKLLFGMLLWYTSCVWGI